MRLRSTTAILSIAVIAALIVVAGCGGGGNGDGVPTPPTPPNGDAQVQSIDAPEDAFPGSAVSVTASVTGFDTATVSYQWTATGGSIEGSGAAVTWTAPVTSGTYTLTVVVTDGSGRQAQRSVNVTVDVEGSGPPPPPWPAD